MAVELRLGESARTTSGVPHLLVRILDREVLACTGGASANATDVSVEDAAGRIECGSCRKFWKVVGKAR